MKKWKRTLRLNKKKYSSKFSNSSWYKMAHKMRRKRLKAWKTQVVASRPHTKADKAKVAAGRMTAMSKTSLITTMMMMIMKQIPISRAMIKKMIENCCI